MELSDYVSVGVGGECDNYPRSEFYQNVPEGTEVITDFRAEGGGRIRRYYEGIALIPK
ncbi:hypothetical protein J4443_02250 [Candidatus Woesearchaeota archaeon]|nr:hypothetical protein [Candidatus Woesearchaeota archaeon]